MAERLFAELCYFEGVATKMDELTVTKSIAKADITITPVSEKYVMFTYFNDIPVVTLAGGATVSYEYGSDEPTWTDLVEVTDGDDTAPFTFTVDTSEVDMDTVGTFSVYVTAYDKGLTASDPLEIEITITDTVAPVITLTATTVDVQASDVATWTPATNITSAVDAYDGDVSADVTFTYKQETSGGTAIADLAGARTYLGTEGNAVYVTYDVDDSSSNSATTKSATFTAVADA